MVTHTVPIEQAHAELERLIDEAVAGAEVIITRGDTPVARLVGVARPARREFGRWRGLIEISDDFDAPLDDFVEYIE